MRDLNVYKAEIFRRSEEKIKERKRNRNRAFAFCIPLCLVIATMAFAKMPDISFSNISDESVSSDSDAMFIQVEVKSLNDKLQSNVVNTDAEEVSDIYLMIQSAFETAVQDNVVTDDFSDMRVTETSSNVIVQDSLSLFSSSKYEIAFTSKDGETITYTLDGNKLTDDATKESITISNEQCFEIQTKLGLIITWEEEK